MARNLDDWVHWAYNNRGPHITKQDIVLVIGHIKAEKWRLKSYPSLDPDNSDTSSVRFQVPLADAQSSHTLQDYISGATQISSTFDDPIDRSGTPTECIFLSGLFVGLKDEINVLGLFNYLKSIVMKPKSTGAVPEASSGTFQWAPEASHQSTSQQSVGLADGIGSTGQESEMAVSDSVHMVSHQTHRLGRWNTNCKTPTVTRPANTQAFTRSKS